jgi:hypothetical protein
MCALVSLVTSVTSADSFANRITEEKVAAWNAALVNCQADPVDRMYYIRIFTLLWPIPHQLSLIASDVKQPLGFVELNRLGGRLGTALSEVNVMDAAYFSRLFAKDLPKQHVEQLAKGLISWSGLVKQNSSDDIDYPFAVVTDQKYYLVITGPLATLVHESYQCAQKLRVQ